MRMESKEKRLETISRHPILMCVHVENGQLAVRLSAWQDLEGPKTQTNLITV